MKLSRPSDLESIAKSNHYSEEELYPALRKKVIKYLKSKTEAFHSYTYKDGYSFVYFLEHALEVKKAIAVLDPGRNEYCENEKRGSQKIEIT